MKRKHRAQQFGFKLGREDFRLVSETCDDPERQLGEREKAEVDRKEASLNQLTLCGVDAGLAQEAPRSDTATPPSPRIKSKTIRDSFGHNLRPEVGA